MVWSLWNSPMNARFSGCVVACLLCMVFVQSVPALAQTSSTPAIGVSPSSLSFTAMAGGSNPASKALNISNTGGGTLYWSTHDPSGWLISTGSGTNNGSVQVYVNQNGLVAGTYSTSVTISASGYPSQTRTIPVTLTVTTSGGGSSPTISYSPTSLSFTGTIGGPNSANQSLRISNSGGGTLSWTVTDSRGWLGVSPASGTNTGTVTVFATPSG
jgi:Viral BACON domain